MSRFSHVMCMAWVTCAWQRSHGHCLLSRVLPIGHTCHMHMCSAVAADAFSSRYQGHPYSASTQVQAIQLVMTRCTFIHLKTAVSQEYGMHSLQGCPPAHPRGVDVGDDDSRVGRSLQQTPASAPTPAVSVPVLYATAAACVGCGCPLRLPALLLVGVECVSDVRRGAGAQHAHEAGGEDERRRSGSMVHAFTESRRSGLG